MRRTATAVLALSLLASSPAWAYSSIPVGPTAPALINTIPGRDQVVNHDLNLRAGQVVAVTGDASATCVQMDLIGSAGTPIRTACLDDEFSRGWEYVAPVTGTYRVRMTSRAGEPVGYNVRGEADCPGNVTSVCGQPFGTAWEDRVSSFLGDKDYILFNLRKGRTYTFEAEDGVSPEITLRDRNDRVLATGVPYATRIPNSEASAIGSRIVFKSPGTGRVWLAVRLQDGSGRAYRTRAIRR
jgi:hypothetical protein